MNGGSCALVMVLGSMCRKLGGGGGGGYHGSKQLHVRHKQEPKRMHL